MDSEYEKKKQPPARRCDFFLASSMLFVSLATVMLLTCTIMGFIKGGLTPANVSEGELGGTREVHSPGHRGSPVPDGQLSMASGNAPEDLVVQERALHVLSDDDARRYTKEQLAEQDVFPHGYTKEEQLAKRDPDGNEVAPPPFKLPKLPIPSEILDFPIEIPTHVSDILGDLPAVPTIPTDPGDIVDSLPTDPGELISDLPIPPLPTIPPVPTLPVPVPIPTGIPEIPVPTGTDLPHVPLPTVLPPGKPIDPGNAPELPDITEIPHRVIGLLHHAISKLSTSEDTPKFLRDILRLILRILNRVAGGDPVPKPKPPKPTLPLPTLPTKTRLPTLPTLPLPTLRPRPTLTLPARAAGEKKVWDGDAASGERERLRAVVSDEVWASADWRNPILAPIEAAGAMVAFDVVYRVAEAFKETDDEAERERLLGLVVVVDDEDEVVA